MEVTARLGVPCAPRFPGDPVKLTVLECKGDQVALQFGISSPGFNSGIEYCWFYWYAESGRMSLVVATPHSCMPSHVIGSVVSMLQS